MNDTKRFLAGLFAFALLLPGWLGLQSSARETVEQAPLQILEQSAFEARIPNDGQHSRTARAKRGAALPTSYNSNSLGYVTAVRNQGTLGSCWAHAANASCETYMIKNAIPVGKNGAAATKSLNLSEYHTVWYGYNDAYDALGMTAGDSTGLSDPSKTKFTSGAGWNIPGFLLMRWEGPASESTPALSYAKCEAYANGTNTTSLGADYAYQANVAHVQELVLIPQSNREELKRCIMDYGAGWLNYYNDNKYNNRGAYYCTSQTGINHAVTVVGWDDNYAKSNFKTAPPANGAWICKNSWGTANSYCKSGYIYISYYDTSVSPESHRAAFFRVEPVDNYDYNYQVDGGSINGFVSLPSGTRVVNKFVARGQHEMLRAAAVCAYSTDVSYTLRVYTGTNPNQTDPTSGRLVHTQSGVFPYQGYHTVEFVDAAGRPVEIPLTQGEQFAVEFELSTEAETLPIAADYSKERYTHVQRDGVSVYRKPTSSGWVSNTRYNWRIKAYSYACRHTGAVRVAASAASCTKAGNPEYWRCPVCERCFADAACTQELESLSVPAPGHALSYADNGNGTHRYGCTRCDYVEIAAQTHSYQDGSCICGAVQSLYDPELRFLSRTLNLQSYIGVDYTIDTAKALRSRYREIYLTAELDGKPVTVELMKAATNYKVYELRTTATQMTQELRTCIYGVSLADGKLYHGSVNVWSVRDGVMDLLAKETDANRRRLEADLLKYGAASQLVFQVNTADPADSRLGNFEQYATKTTPRIGAICVTSGSGVDFRTKSLSLASTIELQFLFSYKNLELDRLEARIVHNGETKTLALTPSTASYAGFSYEGLASNELRKYITVGIYDKTTGQPVTRLLTLSVEALAAEKLASYADDPAKLELLYALMRYGDSASAVYTETR